MTSAQIIIMTIIACSVLINIPLIKWAIGIRKENTRLRAIVGGLPRATKRNIIK
jgi:hypothetical protein